MCEFVKDLERLTEILGHKKNWELHIPALRKLVSNFNNKYRNFPNIDNVVFGLHKKINAII